MRMASEGSSATNPVPLVSVSVTAFNSEMWLGRALDSVLMQETSFPIEIVVGDDCSRDGTVAVANAYRERSPQSIRVLARSANVGMQRNYYETFEQCRGKYIAWLDADDYWTAPEKLEMQVQTMEADPTVSACGHFGRAVTNDGTVEEERYPFLPPGRYGAAEIIRHNFLLSATIMFRNGIHHGLPQWFFDLPGLVDWPVLVLAGLSGDIVLLDRLMADYTFTQGSAYNSKGSIYGENVDLRFLEVLESFVPIQWRRTVRAGKGEIYERLAYHYREEGDFRAARKAALKAFRTPYMMDNIAGKSKAMLATIFREAQWRLRGERARH
jgi:glycosyltransferase involved in cell wall biosynthesis